MTTKQFNRLSKAKKKVLVAQDVISMIKSKFINVSTGNYIAQLYFKHSEGDLDVQCNFDKLKDCTVCALGGAMLSTTKFANTLNFNQLDDFHEQEDSIKLLESVFTSKEMLLIETAFENYDGSNTLVSDIAKDFYYEQRPTRIAQDFYNETLTRDETIACVKFHNKYRNETNRLIAIMENIILNETFIP